MRMINLKVDVGCRSSTIGCVRVVWGWFACRSRQWLKASSVPGATLMLSQVPGTAPPPGDPRNCHCTWFCYILRVCAAVREASRSRELEAQLSDARAQLTLAEQRLASSTEAAGRAVELEGELKEARAQLSLAKAKLGAAQVSACTWVCSWVEHGWPGPT